MPLNIVRFKLYLLRLFFNSLAALQWLAISCEQVSRINAWIGVARD